MLEALDSPWRAYAQHLLILVLFLYAMRRGAGPEKAASAILLAMVLLDYLYHLVFPRGQIYDSINYGHLINDLLALIGFGILAVKANRIYPLWMLGAQIISVLMHFNRTLSPEIEPLSYLVLTRLPSYLQLGALIVGIASHRLRISRYGTYRSWRAS